MHYLRTRFVCCAMCTTFTHALLAVLCARCLAVQCLCMHALCSGETYLRGLWILCWPGAFSRYVCMFWTFQTIWKQTTCTWVSECLLYLWMLPLEQDGFVVPPFNITVYAWEWVNEFYVVPANLVSSTTGATCSHPNTHPARFDTSNS